MITEWGHVLVVEHDEINQMIVKELLECHGIQVTLASSGLQALPIIETADLSCVILASHLTDMSGVELTQIIRKLEQHECLPIIGLTEDNSIGFHEHCFLLGMNAILTMPIDAEVFYLKISKWLNKISPSSTVIETTETADYPLTDSLDIKQALDRLHFTMQQYSSFLIRFRDDFSDVIDRLQGFENSGEIHELKLLIHTLRGAAGFMSANKVFSEASLLEEALINQAIATKLSFIELEQALGELFNFIDFKLKS